MLDAAAVAIAADSTWSLSILNATIFCVYIYVCIYMYLRRMKEKQEKMHWI